MPTIPCALPFGISLHVTENRLASPLRLSPAERARSLIRNGAIQLSLYDAIALAIENNLDVEVAR